MCDTNSELACCYHSFNAPVPLQAGSAFTTAFDHSKHLTQRHLSICCEQSCMQQEGVQVTRLSKGQKAQNHRPSHHSGPTTGFMTVLCVMHGNNCPVVTCMQSRDGKHEGSDAADAHQAYAGPNPWAVVVKLLHTVVTNSTVGATGRPPVIAGGAPFGLNHKAIDLVLLVCWPASASTHPL